MGKGQGAEAGCPPDSRDPNSRPHLHNLVEPLPSHSLVRPILPANKLAPCPGVPGLGGIMLHPSTKAIFTCMTWKRPSLGLAASSLPTSSSTAAAMLAMLPSDLWNAASFWTWNGSNWQAAVGGRGQGGSTSVLRGGTKPMPRKIC